MNQWTLSRQCPSPVGGGHHTIHKNDPRASPCALKETVICRAAGLEPLIVKQFILRLAELQRKLNSQPQRAAPVKVRTLKPRRTPTINMTLLTKYVPERAHAQSRLTLSDPRPPPPPAIDYSPPRFSIHGIFQARILEWAAISSSRGSSLTQKLNLHLLYLLSWQVDSLPLSHMGI